MVKRIKQFRYYSNNQMGNNNPDDKQFFVDGRKLSEYMPIVHIGVQTLPGTKIFLNSNWAAPIIVGATGIYELDLDGTTGLINELRIDAASMDIIDRTKTGYIIIDIVYETEED